MIIVVDRNSAPDALTEYLYLPNGVVQMADAEGTVTKRTLLASGQVAREEVLIATPVVSFNAAEQHVFDRLEGEKRWQMLNDAERKHAIDYIQDLGGFR